MSKFPASKFPAKAVLAAALSLTVAGSAVAQSHYESAVFAGGCFWSMEHDMEPIPGVVSVVVGYSGGHTSNPSYQDVSSETTGHLESVKVTYDPQKISYAQLVQRYWHVIDPTDDGGAFCDRGASYHSAVFVASPEQRRIVEASEAGLEHGPLQGKHIATQVRPAMPFWPAETYHQHYPQKNPVAYAEYRFGCGKDRRLHDIWGPLALK